MKVLQPDWHLSSHRLHQYYLLTKPRVVSLIVFCAVIGMFLAVPDRLPSLDVVLAGTVGIALVAGAAAAVNCLVEQKIDALMARTRGRPLPRGELGSGETLLFSGLVGGAGLSLLYQLVNPLTMWLTLATFVGYAIIYTVILKPATPQNIVIGGASGAMPPVLGWAAVTGDVTYEPLLLFLIIFAWTPPGDERADSAGSHRSRESDRVRLAGSSKRLTGDGKVGLSEDEQSPCRIGAWAIALNLIGFPSRKRRRVGRF